MCIKFKLQTQWEFKYAHPRMKRESLVAVNWQTVFDLHQCSHVLHLRVMRCKKSVISFSLSLFFVLNLGILCAAIFGEVRMVPNDTWNLSPIIPHFPIMFDVVFCLLGFILFFHYHVKNVIANLCVFISLKYHGEH